MSDTPAPTSDSTRLGRRDALRLGGIGVSLAALVAACGDDRGGNDAPGRVGYAPPGTEPPAYPVDDAVLLRTAVSVEYTVIDVYRQILDMDTLSGEEAAFVDTLIGRHEAVIEELDALTEAAGGTPRPCSNSWMDERLIAPIEATIAESDDPARDQGDLAVALEDLTTETLQMFSGMVEDVDARVGLALAAADTAQQAATLAVLVGGPEAAISPDLVAGDAENDDEDTAENPAARYALPSTFGSVAQFEMNLGAADENGVRASFLFATPADNSYIYNELEPSC